MANAKSKLSLPIVIAGVVAALVIVGIAVFAATSAPTPDANLDTREVTTIDTGDGGQIKVIADSVKPADPNQSVTTIVEEPGDPECDHELSRYTAEVVPASYAEVVISEEGWYLPHDNETRYATEDEAREAGKEMGLRGVDGQPVHKERITEERIVPAQTVEVEVCSKCGLEQIVDETTVETD